MIDIFQRHPQHPGAAHYIIHAFDDPDHAILALPAARAYSKIAPSAAHALHMPSHDLRTARYVGRRDRVEHRRLQGRGRSRDREGVAARPEDFHTLSWLQYAYLEEGKFDDAAKAVATAKAVAEKDESPRVRDGYASMKARQVVETEKWEKLALSPAPVKDGGAPGYDGSAAYVFAAGFSAAHLGDLETARRALEVLTAMEKQAASGSNAYRSKPISVMAKEVASGIAHMEKNVAEAERLLKEATAIEATLDAPSGPPEPIKPSFELYGQFLMSQGRQKEAAAQFQQALLRMPNRRISVQGLSGASPTRTTQAGIQ